MVLSPNGLTVQPHMRPVVLQGLMWHSTHSSCVEQPCTACFDSLHSSNTPASHNCHNVASEQHRQAAFMFSKVQVVSSWHSPQSLGHVCLACSIGSSLFEFRQVGRSCCDWPRWGKECKSASRGSAAPETLLPPVIETITLKCCVMSCGKTHSTHNTEKNQREACAWQEGKRYVPLCNSQTNCTSTWTFSTHTQLHRLVCYCKFFISVLLSAALADAVVHEGMHQVR